jgi:hypothetical protein
MKDINRWKSNLTGNIYGAINILKNSQMMGSEFEELFNNFCDTDRGLNFNTELLNEEIMDNIDAIIEKHEKEPF